MIQFERRTVDRTDLMVIKYFFIQTNRGEVKAVKLRGLHARWTLVVDGVPYGPDDRVPCTQLGMSARGMDVAVVARPAVTLDPRFAARMVRAYCDAPIRHAYRNQLEF